MPINWGSWASVSPSTVLGGSTSTGIVTLSGNAPVGGLTIALSSNSAFAILPTSVVIPGGQTTATFTVTTAGVSSLSNATITASLNGSSESTTLTIDPPTFTSLVISPASVLGGNSSTGTVNLNGPAGPTGAVINLSSGSSSATVPATVSVLANQMSATFTIDTSPVSSPATAIITGTFNGQSQTATLTVNPATLASLTLSPTAVMGGNPSTGTVTLTLPAVSGGTTVAISSGSSLASVPPSVTIAAGKTSANFTVTTTAVNTQTPAVISAALGSQSLSATLNVNPAALISITLSPTSLLGGASSTGTVTLNGPSGSGGAIVALHSNNDAVIVPTTVTIPASQTSTTFSISTTGVNAKTSVTITAAVNGVSLNTTLVVTPTSLLSVSLVPSLLTGGSSSTGTVTLSSPAATGGTTVNLLSNNGAATLPPSVTIPGGNTSTTFTVSTTGVSAQTSATISATLNGVSQTATLTINPASLLSLNLAPSSVTGGGAATGTITLAGAAGPGGATIGLSSTSSIASLPSSVVVPAGLKSTTFAITTVPGAYTVIANISATYSGASLSSSLTILPATLSSLSINPVSVAGIATVVGTVTLSGHAPPSGMIVGLQSNSSFAPVPGYVTVTPGQSSATFTMTTSPVSSLVVATISASINGVIQTAKLTLSPIGIASLSFSPASLTGGTASSGTIILNGLSPKGGTLVHLKSSGSSVSVPSTVSIPAGQTSASFTASTSTVSSQQVVTVSATFGSSTQSAVLTVNPPVLKAIGTSPASVTGGSSATGTATLSGPAPPGGMVVKLTCSLSSAMIPASVSIPAGKSSVTFSVTTTPVAQRAAATITGSLNGLSQYTNLTVTPPNVTSLALSPTTVVGGKSSTGTIKVDGAAPVGGLVVALSSNSSSAKVPVSVTIAAGKTSATFSVTTSAVASKTTANITAATGSSTATAILTIS